MLLAKQVMTKRVNYLTPEVSLVQAAKTMRDQNCGFLPIGSGTENTLQGVITDRDIAIRAVADGLDPSHTCVGNVMSDHVCYCFADDEISEVAEQMRRGAVFRLLVLNNPKQRTLRGVITLGDILRHEQEALEAKLTQENQPKVA